MISNISIGLISSNDELLDLFGRSKNSKKGFFSDPLSSGYFKNKSISPKPILYTYNPNRHKKDFELFVKDELDGKDAFLLLVDRDQEHLISRLRDSAFCYIFQCDFSCGRNSRNFLYQISALIIRKFGIILQKMDDSTSTNLMSLPLRNFNSGTLRELSDTCRNGCNIQNFSDQIDSRVKLLSLRRRPIPRQGKIKEKDIKIEDDNNNYFEYGKEKHAKIETGSPHSTSCYISGYFRFGKRIDESRHYNVSKKDKNTISGSFLDCHNGDCVINPSENVTHINMFSNDFMEYFS